MLNWPSGRASLAWKFYHRSETALEIVLSKLRSLKREIVLFADDTESEPKNPH